MQRLSDLRLKERCEAGLMGVHPQPLAITDPGQHFLSDWYVTAGDQVIEVLLMPYRPELEAEAEAQDALATPIWRRPRITSWSTRTRSTVLWRSELRPAAGAFSNQGVSS